MKRLHPLALFSTLIACHATLPAAPPHALVAPDPHPPPLQICWLEYSHHDDHAGYALAGPSSRKRWSVTASGLLIRHPSGHLLVDLGNSTRFEEELSGVGFGARQYLKLGPGGVRTQKTAVQALRELGETPAQLRAIIVSHVHPDHVGGIEDMPGVPVLLSSEELAFATRMKDKGSFAVLRPHAEELELRAQPIVFAPVPYENFDASVDLFGDGAVVFVPLFGHTPGSIGTFVNRSAHERLVHVGDAVDSTEAVDKRVGKSFALGWTDGDSGQADGVVARLSQLHQADPELAILPAHDRDAWMSVFPAGPGTCVGTPGTP